MVFYLEWPPTSVFQLYFHSLKALLLMLLLSNKKILLIFLINTAAVEKVKSVQSALSDLKRPPERLQSQCNYRPFIT